MNLRILTGGDENPVAINPATVTHIEPTEDGSYVWFVDGDGITVLNEFASTCELLAVEVKRSVPKVLKAPQRTAEEWQAEVDEVARQRDEYRKKFESAEYNLQLSVQGEEALSKNIRELEKQILDLDEVIRTVNKKLYGYVDSTWECPTCEAKKLLATVVKPKMEAKP